MISDNFKSMVIVNMEIVHTVNMGNRDLACVDHENTVMLVGSQMSLLLDHMQHLQRQPELDCIVHSRPPSLPFPLQPLPCVQHPLHLP